MDVVVEGAAVRVTDPAPLQELADAWYAKYGDDWHFAVQGDEFVEISDSGGSTEGAHSGCSGAAGRKNPRW